MGSNAFRGHTRPAAEAIVASAIVVCSAKDDCALIANIIALAQNDAHDELGFGAPARQDRAMSSVKNTYEL